MVISLLFGTVDICSPRPLALRSCACWSTFLLWKVPVVIEYLFCKLMVGLSLATEAVTASVRNALEQRAATANTPGIPKAANNHRRHY